MLCSGDIVTSVVGYGMFWSTSYIVTSVVGCVIFDKVTVTSRVALVTVIFVVPFLTHPQW